MSEYQVQWIVLIFMVACISTMFISPIAEFLVHKKINPIYVCLVGMGTGIVYATYGLIKLVFN